MPEIRSAKSLTLPERDDLRFLPEGPIGIGPGKFSWVAIQHGSKSTVGSLNLFDLRSRSNRSIDLPGRPGFAFPTPDPNRFVVGIERSLGWVDVRDGTFESFADGVDDDVENTIINDGLVFEDNLIFGTKDLEFRTPKAGLYLYRGRGGDLIRLRDDQICSNGKMIQRRDDRRWLLDIDSPVQKLVRYELDVEGGSLSPPETVIDFAGDRAVPDGAILTPDGDGVIVSMFRPEVADFGETRWYDLDTSDLRCTWTTAGSPKNTCPALIANEGRLDLIITTAVEGFDDADRLRCPAAGEIFLGETPWLADRFVPVTADLPKV